MRVVVADDSLLLREGVARLLAETGFEVVATAGDAEELLAAVAADRPDVAVVDVRMPPTNTDEGLQAARAIRARHPEVGVLVLSQYARVSYATELLADSAEGVGYLLKDRVSDIAEFAAAVRRVGTGGSALDPTVVAQLVNRRRVGSGGVGSGLSRLSQREREVLGLMAEGKSNQAIAGDLFITERTVEKHTSGIFSKLQLPDSATDHRRVLAVLAYLQAG